MRPTFFSMLANETGAEILKAFRQPAYVIPTLALPVAFYSLFAVAIPGSSDNAGYLLATYGIFAVMGPAIFGFGAGVANERDLGWLGLKRAAPAPGAVYIGAKMLATLVFAAIALMLIYAVAGYVAGVELPRQTWGMLIAMHLAASIPFVLVGLALGFTMGANAAVAMANLIFLSFAALGGLWIPVTIFPASLQAFAQFLPSYHLGELALHVSGAPGDHAPEPHLMAVTIMTGILAVLAFTAWIRQR